MRLGLPLSLGGNKPEVKEYYEQLCRESGVQPMVSCPEEAPQVVIVDDTDRAWDELGEQFCRGRTCDA